MKKDANENESSLFTSQWRLNSRLVWGMTIPRSIRKTVADPHDPSTFVGADDLSPKSQRLWSKFFREEWLGPLVSAQVVFALLIDLRSLPLRSSYRSMAGARKMTALVVIFILLSYTVLLCFWRRRRNQQRYRHLLHLAYHDMCTGLPNRAAVDRVLNAWLLQGDQVSCMYLEVNGVGVPAASLPNGCMEDFWRSIAARLQSLANAGDLLAMITTDRFVLLLNGAHSQANLTTLAEAILSVMAPPHSLHDQPISTSVNIGISSSPGDAKSTAALLTAAKNAMMAARSEERNSYRFAQEMHSGGDARSHTISGKLQRAILDGALQLVYQPIYRWTGAMVAAEALARWHDPEEGPITPGEFVPIAEATGLIVPLSNWVLRKACRQMAEWEALGSSIQRIAVNVSVKQVARKDFISTVRHTLEEAGLEAGRLELEVTEGALANDFEAVNRNLQELRQFGVRISIDDFGTGYSSLGRVRELNADVLKIDRLFTQGATESAGGAAMVQAIIDMAHTMQLSVIAEGVETKEQMKILRAMACDEMQGFLLARPQTAELITTGIQSATGAATSPPTPPNGQPSQLVPGMA